MTLECNFTVPGCPVPYPGVKHRIVAPPRRKPFVETYTDAKSKAYRRAIRVVAGNAARWKECRDGSVMRRDAPWPDPKGCAKHLHKMRIDKRPGQKAPKCDCAFCSTEFYLRFTCYMPDHRTRDLLNVGKNIEDAITGVIWYDDTQSIPQAQPKEYDKMNPRTEITVTEYRRDADDKPLDLFDQPKDDPIVKCRWCDGSGKQGDTDHQCCACAGDGVRVERVTR